MSMPLPPDAARTGTRAGGTNATGTNAGTAHGGSGHVTSTHAGGPNTADNQGDIGDVSLGQLVGDLATDLSTLMRQEIALAQAEIKQEATKTVKGAGSFGGAALAGYFTVLFLSVALWWALAGIIGHSWSALVVAVLWGIVAAVLAASGRAKMRRVNPRPDQTIDTLKTVPEALKGQPGGTR